MSILSWFKGIRGRLLAVALLPILGFAVSSYVAFNGVSRVGDFVTTAHKQAIPSMKVLDKLIVARNKYGYHIWASIALHDNPQVRDLRLNMAREAVREWKETFATYDKLTHYPEEMKNLNFIKDNKDTYLGMLEKVIDLTAESTPESLAVAKKLLLEDIWKLGSAIGENNAAIAKAHQARAEADGAESEVIKSSVYLWTGIINTTVSIVILAIIMLISGRISSAISEVVGKLSGASSDVTNSVAQLNLAGNSLSASSSEAAASLEETVASLEELTSMVQLNSDSAKQAAVLSMTSREAAERGEKEIRGLISSMNEISKSSKKIEEIISVIDDIAFQTNLLALNAAVEAARAGEQGKGFAVVAEAVRALAQRSSVAAKDISGLIHQSVEQIEHGSRIADQSGEVLGSIVESVKKVADLNNEIANASSEQTAGLQQIGKAMNQLDHSSQSNAASAEEIAASGAEINGLAQTTQLLTLDLNRIILGSSEAEQSRAA